MAQGGGGTPAPLTERPYSKVQLFCSNLPWSVNGKVRRLLLLCRAAARTVASTGLLFFISPARSPRADAAPGL